MSASPARRARRHPSTEAEVAARDCARGEHAWKTGGDPSLGQFCAHCGEPRPAS